MVDLQSSGRPGTGGQQAGRPKSWLPTRKWWYATVIALGAIASLWVADGEFDKPVIVAVIGAVVQAITTYLVPNQDTPGGVPMQNA